MIGRASVSRGEAIVTCPLCRLAAPEGDEVEALATVGGEEGERGPGAFLEGFECEAGHKLGDLNPAQEGEVLERAQEWRADALEALKDAYWDGRIDRLREDG